MRQNGISAFYCEETSPGARVGLRSWATPSFARDSLFRPPSPQAPSCSSHRLPPVSAPLHPGQRTTRDYDGGASARAIETGTAALFDRLDLAVRPGGDRQVEA